MVQSPQLPASPDPCPVCVPAPGPLSAELVLGSGVLIAKVLTHLSFLLANVLPPHSVSWVHQASVLAHHFTLDSGWVPITQSMPIS